MATLGIFNENAKGYFLGMDFGTTNSVLSIYNPENNEMTTIPIDGSYTFKTAVQFEEDFDDKTKLNKIFGDQARESSMIYPESTVLNVKRLLGTDESVDITVADKEYHFTPEQVAGEIMFYLRQKAYEYLRDEFGADAHFENVVITVPANSTDKQKKLTKEAAIIAGFDEDEVHLRLEPAAAALNYEPTDNVSKNVLVYDFGGGTFDACILSVSQNENAEQELSVLSTYGDNNLGGNDIDKIIVDMLIDKFNEATGGDIDLFDLNADDGVSARAKKIAVVRLFQAANSAKERLSNTKSTKISMTPFIQEPTIINLNVEISREDFYEYKRKYALGEPDYIFEDFKGLSVSDIIEKTLDCIKKCLEAASLGIKDIDEIFLVGGSSSIPKVQEVIFEMFNKEPYKAKFSPAFSISSGAAKYAYLLSESDDESVSIHEKTIHSLGIEIMGRRFLEVVGPGLTIPESGLSVEIPEPLSTSFDNVESMAITVYENTQPSRQKDLLVTRKGMKRLSGTTLRGIPKAKKGHEKVIVKFFISRDNCLKVTASSVSNEGIQTVLSVDDLY